MGWKEVQERGDVWILLTDSRSVAETSTTLWNNLSSNKNKSKRKKENMAHIHNGIYSTMKRNEIILFEATWKNLEIIILSEASQAEKDLHTGSRINCPNLQFYWQCTRLPFPPYYLQDLVRLVFLVIAILMGSKWHLTVILICISLMIGNVEHLFIDMLAIWMLSLNSFFYVYFCNFFLYSPPSTSFHAHSFSCSL